jgi:hypothetical protein
MLRLFLLLTILVVPEITQAAMCTSTTVGASICSALLPAQSIFIDLIDIAKWIALGFISFGFILFVGFKIYNSFHSAKLNEWSNYQSDGIHFSNDEFSRDEHLQYLEDQEQLQKEFPAFEGSHDERDRSNQAFEGSHDERDQSELFDRTSLDYVVADSSVETEDQLEDRLEQERIDANIQTLYFREDGELVDVNGQVVSEDEQLEANIDVYSSKGELRYSVRDGQAIDVDSGEVVEYLPNEEKDNFEQEEQDNGWSYEQEEQDNSWSYVSHQSVSSQETEDEYHDRIEQELIDLRNSR